MLTDDERTYLRETIIEKAKKLANTVSGSDNPILAAQNIMAEIGSEIGPYTTNPEALRSPQERAEEAIERIMDRWLNPRNPGLMTGLECLDVGLLGLRPRSLITLGARPGKGKTSIANQIANNVATINDAWVIYFSPEQGDQELQDRTISMFSNVKAYKIATGKNLDDTEIEAIRLACDRMSKTKVYTYDVTNLDVDSVEAVFNHVNSTVDGGVQAIFVDYLQRMAHFRGSKAEHESVAQNVRGLKNIAKTYNIPVLLASQFNRPQEKGARPGLADFRYSGDIEQESDTCIAMHYADAETEEEYKAKTISVELYCLKNRHGSLWSANLTFHRDSTSFYERM